MENEIRTDLLILFISQVFGNIHFEHQVIFINQSFSLYYILKMTIILNNESSLFQESIENYSRDRSFI